MIKVMLKSLFCAAGISVLANGIVFLTTRYDPSVEQGWPAWLWFLALFPGNIVGQYLKENMAYSSAGVLLIVVEATLVSFWFCIIFTLHCSVAWLKQRIHEQKAERSA